MADPAGSSIDVSALDRLHLDPGVSMNLPGNAGSSDKSDIKDFDAAMSEIRRAHPWTDEEYEKHIAGLRERYPMLTELVLRGHPLTNANLSSIQNTNKYARLADAYNAKMRYADTGVQVGWDSGTTYSSPKWQNVDHIETQDQKQMDQLRQAQADMRKYQLDEESHFQRDVWKRKADEMQKLVNEDLERQFWQSNEQRRRIKAQFDSWSRMNETQFSEVLTKLGIPAKEIQNAMQLLKDGQYIAYMHLMDSYNLTPQSIDQIYTNNFAAPVIAKMVNGQITMQQAARDLAKVPAEYVINSVMGIINQAAASKDPPVQAAGMAARSLLTSVAQGGQYTAEHLPQILSILAGVEVAKGLAPWLVKLLPIGK
jgi:hypothetical protein